MAGFSQQLYTSVIQEGVSAGEVVLNFTYSGSNTSRLTVLGSGNFRVVPGTSGIYRIETTSTVSAGRHEFTLIAFESIPPLTAYVLVYVQANGMYVVCVRSSTVHIICVYLCI